MKQKQNTLQPLSSQGGPVRNTPKYHNAILQNKTHENRREIAAATAISNNVDVGVSHK